MVVVVGFQPPPPPEIYSDAHLKAADPRGRSRTDASAVLLSRVLVGCTKGGNLYCRIKMFHFQSQASVKAGEGQNRPPQSLLLQSRVPLGSMLLSGFVLCSCSLTPRLHYGWDDADVQSPCVTPQDTTRSVSINVLWKPCCTVCPLHNSINAHPFTARSWAFVPALTVEMVR